MKTAEEMVQFGQGNVEAWVKSGQILAAGLQDIGKQVAANAQATFDETMSTFKAMTGVRSMKEAFDMQATLTRSAMEKAMAETGRLTEASFKLAEQSAAPLAARFSLVVEKFGNGPDAAERRDGSPPSRGGRCEARGLLRAFAVCGPCRVRSRAPRLALFPPRRVPIWFAGMGRTEPGGARGAAGRAAEAIARSRSVPGAGQDDDE